MRFGASPRGAATVSDLMRCDTAGSLDDGSLPLNPARSRHARIDLSQATALTLRQGYDHTVLENCPNLNVFDGSEQ